MPAAAPAATAAMPVPQSLSDQPLVHVLYDPPPVFTYPASWHTMTQLHLFPSNPYPSPPPPPPIAHKVWILDCRSCGIFLTNRGMKAVLLLRPNVSLYSSDALPVNCSAYSANPDVLRPATSCHPSSSHAPRTCECLTQTLCCHGCGSTVGYMIVIPCSRCTSSITATNRATNGHRFVFHSSEILGTERHYIPDEPGVVPFEANFATPSVSNPPPNFYPPGLPIANHNSRELSHALPSQLFTQFQSNEHSQPPSPRPRSEYLPTPPLELADLSPTSSASPSPISESFPHHYSNIPTSGAQSPRSSSHPLPYHRSRSPPLSVPSQSPHSTYLSHRHLYSRPLSASPQPTQSSPPPLIHHAHSFGNPTDSKEPPPSRKLRAGDVLFWHHLARNGEIPGVTEDKRARERATAINAGARGRMMFDR